MTEPSGIEGLPARPILIDTPDAVQTFQNRPGGSTTVQTPSRSRQQERIGGRVNALLDAFSDGSIIIDDSLPATDPELVVVLETIDTQGNFFDALRRLGIELILEADEELDPDEDFPRIRTDGSLTGSTTPVSSCFHAICTTRQAAQNLVSLWRSWVNSGRLSYGYGAFADLFSHLHDVRPWGPKDRLRLGQIIEYLEGMLDNQLIPVEIELWYRAAAADRQRSQARITSLITREGGNIAGSAQIGEVGYHAVAAEVPVSILRDLSAGNYEAVSSIRSSDVLYFRACGQTIERDVQESHLDENTRDVDADPINLPPVVALLDGLPLTNHELLRDRIEVFDPDGHDGHTEYEASARRHGTAMASVLVWGDLSKKEPAARRRVLVRPVLTVQGVANGAVEEFPSGVLVPDLMRRVFRELFSGTASHGPVGQSICIINLSLGDPAMPFDIVPSAWARTIDWLSNEYGVLVVVSAGNHRNLIVSGVTTQELVASTGDARREIVRNAVASQAMNRRLLSPAESLNSLTVGAIHADGLDGFTLGNRFDPSDGQVIHSPASAVGLGQRRAVKPDIVEEGGRMIYRQPFGNGNPAVLTPGTSSFGPGIKVAAWHNGNPNAGRSFEVGTSPAAALVSRQAARLYDAIASAAGDRRLDRRQISAALKTLLVHGSRWPSNLDVSPLSFDQTVGFGIFNRDISLGCEEHEATVLFIGQLRANEQQTLRFPLPDGMQSSGMKRVTATMTWLSPVNWRSRQYRRAKLTFEKPEGLIAKNHLGGVDVGYNEARRGTVLQQVYETGRATSAGVGTDMAITVRCREQAGGLSGASVTYAAAVSLWLAPELGVNVYDQVRLQLQSRVRIDPRG